MPANGKPSSSKKEAEKIKAKTSLILKTIVFLTVLVCVGISYIWKTDIEDYLNFKLNLTPPSTDIVADDMVVHYIDVGQADAIFIQFPNQKTMLIDAGQSTARHGINPTRNNALFSYLAHAALQTDPITHKKVIDYFLITHSDFDHIGGGSFILQDYTVNTIFRPLAYTVEETRGLPHLFPYVVFSRNGQTVTTQSTTYVNLVNQIAAAEAQGTEVIFFDSESDFNEGGVMVDFLSPTPAQTALFRNVLRTSGEYLGDGSELYHYGAPSAIQLNNRSPLVKMSYKGKAFLFAGDMHGDGNASQDMEQAVLQHYAGNLSALNADVLKIAHHGSNTSSSAAFINAVSPTYAVISVGKNGYGHPGDGTLGRLSDAGLASQNVFRTDLNGNIQIGFTAEGELAMVSNFSNETGFYIQWWILALCISGVTFIFLFVPSYFKQQQKNKKKSK